MCMCDLLFQPQPLSLKAFGIRDISRERFTREYLCLKSLPITPSFFGITLTNINDSILSLVKLPIDPIFQENKTLQCFQCRRKYFQVWV